METERILITVRTYPNLSGRHIETVCTGGINDRFEWRRLYPVPLRLLDDEKQYRTFDVIRVRLKDNPDGRPESRRPDLPTIAVIGHIGEWPERRDWITRTAVDSMTELLASGRTLAPVRVREVLEFGARAIPASWSPKERELLGQQGLFGGPEPLEKVPFEFRLRWRDGDAKEHDSLFLAWEVGQTWRSWRHKYDDPVERMQDKWMNEVFASERDLWFFMGNFAAHRQHFGVCGTFNPPKEVDANATLF